MNILTDGLPDGVYIDGEFYPVYTDFKNWIKIDGLLCDKDLPMEKRIASILSLCYKKLPQNLEDAMDGVFAFYGGGFSGGSAKKAEKKNSEPLFSFSKDAQMIYSAFYAQYKIDLLKEELHWYQFVALFENLSHEHKLFKVMAYRGAKLCDIKDKSKRAFYAEMKRVYALCEKSEDEKNGEVAESLMGAM